jgi:hypothetical protein
MKSKVDQIQLFGFRHLVANTPKQTATPAVQAKLGGKGPTRMPHIHAVTSKIGAGK